MLPYEESTRAPLVIFDPREPNSGQQLRSGALTGNVDFAPTLLALAGVAAPAGIDGRDLMPAYRDPACAIHEALPILNVWGPAKTHYLGVVTEDAKYVRWPFEGEGFTVAEELFDLEADPLELRQLAGSPEHAELLEAMRGQYDALAQRWRQEAVEHHGHARFAGRFTR